MKKPLWILIALLTLSACGEVTSASDATDKAAADEVKPLPHIPRDPDRPNYVPNPPGFFDQFSPEPYEVRINEHVLMIPMNRLMDRRQGTFVAIHARWPGMKPFMLEDRGPAPYDSITILLNGNKGRSSGKPRDAHQKFENSTVHSPKAFNEQLGLWEYRSKTLPNQPDYYVADVVRKGVDGQEYNESYLIMGGGHLPPGKSVDTMRCQVFYFAKPDVRVTYRFSHKHIADWKAIDHSVRQLVDSFFMDQGPKGE
jgi:hypothetical protein